MTVAQKAPFEFTVLDDRVLADENFFTDECPALVPHCGIVPGRFQIGGDVALNFFERVPGEFAAVEDGGVFGLAEVKQVGWFEHAGKLSKTTWAARRNGGWQNQAAQLDHAASRKAQRRAPSRHEQAIAGESCRGRAWRSGGSAS